MLCPTITAGKLTIGTDNPAYPPWFVGNNPANWVKNVPHYGTVEYPNVYPNVNLFYGSIGEQLDAYVAQRQSEIGSGDP